MNNIGVQNGKKPVSLWGIMVCFPTKKSSYRHSILHRHNLNLYFHINKKYEKPKKKEKRKFQIKMKLKKQKYHEIRKVSYISAYVKNSR